MGMPGARVLVWEWVFNAAALATARAVPRIEIILFMVLFFCPPNPLDVGMEEIK